MAAKERPYFSSFFAVDRAQRKYPWDATVDVLPAGTHSKVDKALSSAGLPDLPATLVGQGSALVWTAVSKDYQLAVISGKDTSASRHDGFFGRCSHAESQN